MRDKRLQRVEELRTMFRNSSQNLETDQKSIDQKSKIEVPREGVSIASLSSDIYDQYLNTNVFSTLKIMENIQPYSVDTKVVVPGSEADPNAPVYGY